MEFLKKSAALFELVLAHRSALGPVEVTLLGTQTCWHLGWLSKNQHWWEFMNLNLSASGRLVETLISHTITPTDFYKSRGTVKPISVALLGRKGKKQHPKAQLQGQTCAQIHRLALWGIIPPFWEHGSVCVSSLLLLLKLCWSSKLLTADIWFCSWFAIRLLG